MIEHLKLAALTAAAFIFTLCGAADASHRSAHGEASCLTATGR